MTGSDTLNVDGGLNRGRKYTGAYSVNADCTGSMVFQISATGTNNFDIVLTDNGREVKLIETDQNTIIIGTAHQQQPPKQQTGC